MSTITTYYCDRCDYQIKEHVDKFHLAIREIKGCEILKESKQDLCLDCFNEVKEFLDDQKSTD